MHTVLELAARALALQLEGASIIQHGGENGRARENAVRSFLENCTPPQFAIDTGFVFDVHGNISKQIDIVIHRTDYHPVFNICGVKYFMVESVVAVFENKSSVASAAKLRTAYENVVSVKSLDKTGGGKNYFVESHFNERRPEHVPERYRLRAFSVYGGIISQASLSMPSFRDAWKSLDREFGPKNRPDIFVDVKNYALLNFVDVEHGPRERVDYASEATSFGFSIPGGSAVSPLVELASRVASRMRVSPVIDYSSDKYFSCNMAHAMNTAYG